MIAIVAERITYYSQEEEAFFFAWVAKIPAVVEMRFDLAKYFLVLRRRRICDRDLRELLALAMRFRIPMAQFAQFADERNREWFCDPGMYWYPYVFGGRAVLPLHQV